MTPLRKNLLCLGIALTAALAAYTGSWFAQEPVKRADLDLPVDAGAQAIDDEHDAPELVIFYGQHYEGDGIFFCCDTSGSMEGAKLKKLKTEVLRSLREFSERVQFGLVFFNSDVHAFPASSRPAAAAPAMKAQASSTVMGQRAQGATCAKPALRKILIMAQLSTAPRKLIIYLSDGVNSCPGQNALEYPREILEEVRQQNVQKIPINTICLGPPQQVDEGWMRQLAEENGGRYSRVLD